MASSSGNGVDWGQIAGVAAGALGSMSKGGGGKKDDKAEHEVDMTLGQPSQSARSQVGARQRHRQRRN